MNEMLLLAELLEKHRLETQEKDKRIAELEEQEEKNERTIKNMGLAIALAQEWIEEKDAKIAELQSILTLFKKDLLASCKKERDKYKAYFDSTLEKDYPANKYPRTKKPNKGM